MLSQMVSGPLAIQKAGCLGSLSRTQNRVSVPFQWSQKGPKMAAMVKMRHLQKIAIPQPRGNSNLNFAAKREGSADAQRVINQDLSCASSMMHSGKLFAHFRRWLCSTKVSVPVTLGNVCRTRYSKKISSRVTWKSSDGLLDLLVY